MRSLISRARVALVVVGITCVSCGKAAFCVRWVDTDQQYQVEVLDRAPPPEYASTAPSCGTARFLMDTGDTLPMRMLDAGVTTCREAGPLLAIPDTRIVDGPHPGGGWNGLQSLSTLMTIALPGGCLARLMIALDPSVGTGGVAVQSDYVLRRTVGVPLEGGSLDACLPDGVVISEAGCMDSWYVKITDSTGRVITKHPDGGL